MYELTCKYDKRQSFYGKACVEEEDGTKTLYSYGTKVCKIEKDQRPVFFDVPKLWSQTTTRHLKEFLNQEGFVAIDKFQMQRDYKTVEV